MKEDGRDVDMMNLERQEHWLMGLWRQYLRLRLLSSVF